MKIKELKERYGVDIRVPSKDKQMGDITLIELSGQLGAGNRHHDSPLSGSTTGGGDVNGCAVEIQNIIARASGAAVGGGMGFGGGGSSGMDWFPLADTSLTHFPTTAAAGGTLRAVGVIFRKSHITNELQMLLEHAGRCVVERWPCRFVLPFTVLAHSPCLVAGALSATTWGRWATKPTTASRVSWQARGNLSTTAHILHPHLQACGE